MGVVHVVSLVGLSFALQSIVHHHCPVLIARRFSLLSLERIQTRRHLVFSDPLVLVPTRLSSLLSAGSPGTSTPTSRFHPGARRATIALPTSPSTLMRPQLSDHSTHPDGDPFAARDALAAQNTPLGRLEARAIEEQRVRDGGAPNASSSSTPSAPAATRSQRRTSNLSASPKRPEVEIPVVVVEDSDDDEGVAASLGTMARASPELGAKGANGSVTPVPKSEDTDVVMGDARQAGQAGPDGGVAAGVSSAPASAGATTAGEASSHAGPSTGMDVPVAVAAAPTRAPRQRSPSPAAPVKPPRPPKTIRLEFEIPKPGDPVEDVPEYSIADAAIEAGYGVDETEAEGSGSGSGSGGSESESEGGTKKVKSKGKEKEKENGDGDTTMEGPVTDPAAPVVVVPAVRYDVTVRVQC
jgi:hypothetical protein